MKKKSFLIVLGVCIGTTGFVWGTNDKPLYKNPDAPIENRVEDLLRRMTLQEKVLHFVSLHPSVLHPTTSMAEAVHLH